MGVTSAELTLVASSLSDWFVLEGGGNWASVEGPAAEWLEIAKGLEDRADVRFKRCCAHLRHSLWDFSSPRNSTGPADSIVLPVDEGKILADHIRKVIAAYVRDPS